MSQEEVYKQLVESTVQILRSIVEDTSIPRNIRRAASDAISVLLSGKGSLEVRASNAISILDEISNAPNMPIHARTKIWECLGKLEQIKGA